MQPPHQPRQRNGQRQRHRFCLALLLSLSLQCTSAVWPFNSKPAQQQPLQPGSGQARVVPLPTIELVVVRHAFSCANAEKRMKTYNLYDFSAAGESKSFNKARDPLLTYYGVARSDSLKDQLRAYVARAFGGRPHAIWASVMMRAQETAYYMLARPANAPIHVVPHVGEDAGGKGFFGSLKGFAKRAAGYNEDNTPAPRAEQEQRLCARNAGVVAAIQVGSDFRAAAGGAALPGETGGSISDLDAFLQWLARKDAAGVPNARRIAGADAGPSDDTVRAVLFTHSNFMSIAFKASKHALTNNCALRVTLKPNRAASRYELVPAGKGGPPIESFGEPNLEEKPAALTLGGMCEHGSGCARYLCPCRGEPQRFDYAGALSGGKCQLERMPTATRCIKFLGAAAPLGTCPKIPAGYSNPFKGEPDTLVPASKPAAEELCGPYSSAPAPGVAA